LRIGSHKISFGVLNFAAAIRGMEEGIAILLPRETITEPLISLSGMNHGRVTLVGDHVEAVVKKYVVGQPKSPVVYGLVSEPVLAPLAASRTKVKRGVVAELRTVRLGVEGLKKKTEPEVETTLPSAGRRTKPSNEEA
jgi:hypothetical protein